MIVISGTVQIKGELRNEAVEKAIWMQRLVEAEPGCISYRFYADLEDPNLIRIFEEWESEAALKAHFTTSHMATFNQVLAKVLASKPKVIKYTVIEQSAL